MTYSNTLGALLQGVSQQPAAIRPQGHVTEQINFVSDVVQGLTARPAAKEVATITGAPADLKFFPAEIGGFRYIIGYGQDLLTAWGEDGVVWPVTYQDNDAKLYVGTDMRGYVHADVLYITNRFQTVSQSSVKDTSDVFQHGAYAYCLGGKFSRTYTVEITYQDDTIAVGKYTTPDGTAVGDAAKAAANHIVEQVTISLRAHAKFKVQTTALVKDNVIGVKHSSPITIHVADDDDGTSMRGHDSSVRDLEHLTELAYHGQLVRVTGSDAGSADDYWLRFKTKGSTGTVGTGFALGGVWEEHYDVSQNVLLNDKTMPHILRWNGAGFTFERAAWEGRRVGDSKTNPYPDFVGHQIKDISGFQSRLVFAAGPYCCMTRTNRPLDFFKLSATTDVVTDPINIASTKKGNSTLDWIVPFDRDLVFLSDPGAGQFIVDGHDLLTPANAAMAQTTAFEMKGGTPPVQTGRTILFPFKKGKYSGIKEFFTNDEVATNGADTLTETLDRYILGTVQHMACSTNLSTVLMRTDSAGAKDTIWVYSYLWQGLEKAQSSWSKWKMLGDVKHFSFNGSVITLVLHHPTTGAHSISTMDMDRPDDPVVGYHVCLDRKRTVVLSGTVDLPFDEARFVQSTGCATIGAEVSSTKQDLGGGNWRYTLAAESAPVGATVIAGRGYDRSVTPTMPFMRDQQGNVRARTHVVVTHFFIDYENIGALDAVMVSPYRDDIVFEVNFFPLDDTPGNTLGDLQSGILEVPWGERSDWSELVIRSSDIRPTTILEVEWAGQPFKR